MLPIFSCFLVPSLIFLHSPLSFTFESTLLCAMIKTGAPHSAGYFIKHRSLGNFRPGIFLVRQQLLDIFTCEIFPW